MTEAKVLRLVAWMGAGVTAAVWSLICLVLFVLVSLVEGVFEGGAAIASAPLGGMDFGIGWLSDLLGDIGQIAMILLWAGGLAAIWFVKWMIVRRKASPTLINHSHAMPQGAASYSTPVPANVPANQPAPVPAKQPTEPRPAAFASSALGQKIAAMAAGKAKPGQKQ
ncbi:MAG: hypothetical protein ACRCWO_07855 [Bosea sp. (in: a-proteobacteria)]